MSTNVFARVIVVFAMFTTTHFASRHIFASESLQVSVPAGQRDTAQQLSFFMNRGAVFSEDEAVAASLSKSLSELITAIRSGKVTDRHVSNDEQDRHSFFMDALSQLKADPKSPAELPLVLKSFSPDGGESFLISVAFMTQRQEKNQIEKIIEFHAYPHHDGYRFRSPFSYRTRTLETMAVGEVRYHFANQIDRGRAEEFVSFKQHFESSLGTKTTELEYYCFDTLDEILRAYGIVYDCSRCNWLKEDLGFIDHSGKRFLTGSGNERFIFDYLIDYMSLSCNEKGDLYPPFVYGMAAYYGGYGLSGDDLGTLKAQFREEIETHPDINFLVEYRKERKSSIQRHYTYFVINAFVCDEVLDIHGFEGMMQLAHTGSHGERFFETLDRLLDIDETSFHELVVRLIQEDG